MSTVDRTANPYEIGVAYVDGKPLEPLGKVERFNVVKEPNDTGLLRTIMEKFFVEESLALSALAYCEGGCEITSSYDPERNLIATTIAPCSRWHP